MKKKLFVGLALGVMVGVGSLANAATVTYDFNSGLGNFNTYGPTLSTVRPVATNGYVQLIAPSSAGGVWAGAIFLPATHFADRFDASFDYRIGGGTGADGMTFAWTKDLNNAGQCGSHGEGYGGSAYGCQDGYAVEFDTYWSYQGNDLVNDNSENHIGLIHESVDNHLVQAVVPEMENTGWHHADIHFDNGNIQVAMDGTSYISTSISGYVPYDAYFGFTAGWGGLDNYFLVDNFTMTTTDPVPEPATMLLMGTGLVGLIGARRKKQK